jgi:uncharacterized protein (TIGR03437 family)
MARRDCCRLLFLAVAATLVAPGQDVGSGTVSEAVRRDFLRAYFRNGFHIRTSLPPTGDVRRFSTGFRQDFPDAAKTPNVLFALIRNNTSDTAGSDTAENTFQVTPEMLSYYTTVASDAGLPAGDTLPCPALPSNSCVYQLFDKSYALFVYATDSGLTSRTFATRDPFFTRWRNEGGVAVFGPAASAEANVVSGAGTGAAATVQRFAFGAIFNVTSGANSGRMFSVRRPVFTLYAASGGETGFLGLPTGEELNAGENRRRQNFEGGAIEYTPGGEAVLRLPVASISVQVTPALQRLNLGDTVRLTAALFAANGTALDNRVVAWVSSNPRVLAVESSGVAVTARAVGGGSATITAVSEGRSSRGVTFFVSAPCCQIGEGAPTPAIAQAFVDAVARSRLSYRLPAPGPVRRLGNGYYQELLPADTASAARFVVAKPDSLASAFVLAGALLGRHTELGGLAGTLGYPVADATTSGRQLFEGGALAGNPPQVVTAPVLTRWAAQQYEGGPAGLPTGAAEPVLSFTATLGVAQMFTNAAYFAHRTGALANRAFLVAGPILTRYLAIGAAGGRLGLPTSDEFLTGGRRRQEFEGGGIDYAPGDAEARVEERGRRPQISATPSVVAPGARLRIAAGGFETGATLRITVGNQPDILVKTQTGAFAWELFVPAGAEPGLVNLRAADVDRNALAVGSYVVQSSSETLARLTKLSGDLQTGLPGARLPQPMRLLVQDENGTPLAGLPVRYNASPGAQVELGQAVTDERGEAQFFLRLPVAEVPALATAEAGGRVTTFSARTQSGTLTNFPRLTAPQPWQALVGAVASMVRFLQNGARVGTPNGLAEPAMLQQFLADFCQFDPAGNRVCDGLLEGMVNLWRLEAFTGGNLEVAPVEGGLTGIRDAVGRGAPVLVALAVGAPSPAATHFVVAIGVDAGGGILVHDPVAGFGRPTLEAYLNGGAGVAMSLAAAVELAPRAASTLGFLVVSPGAAPDVRSVAGVCGYGFGWPAAAYVPAQALPATMATLRFHYCDGRQPAYQLELPGAGTLYSLGTVSSRTALPAAATLQLTRPDTVWIAGAQEIAFSAAAVLNAASFLPALAPGTLVSVFGQGLGRAGQETVVSVGGQPAQVLFSNPFQVNFVLPGAAEPGNQLLRIESAFGSREVGIVVEETAPAVFAQGGRGIVVNRDGSLNAPATPARRGEVMVIYATGLGALEQRGQLAVTRRAVTVEVEGIPLVVDYAGAAPGLAGINQINARIPASLPPGIDLRLVVKQGDRSSPPVLVTIQ